MDHGLTEAAKKLGLAKKNLHALVSAPLTKEDGSQSSVQEWTSTNFITVEMKRGKEQEGLLGKFRKQRDYMEKLIRENVITTDLTASSSKEAMNDFEDSNLGRQLKTLTSENSDFRKQLETFRTEISDLKTENANLKTEVSNLKTENASLKTEVSDLKTENASLVKQMETQTIRISDLEKQVNTLTKQLSELSGMEKVMIRKMLDRCRQKSSGILMQQNVPVLDDGWQFPEDWHKVLNDSSCIQVLQNAGLDSGLSATRFGKRSHQSKGSSAAHDITESPDVYAAIVCKITGESRARMLNVFSFVFESNAEDLAFDDDY